MEPLVTVRDHGIRRNKEKTRGQHINIRPAATGRHTPVSSRNKAGTKQKISNLPWQKPSQRQEPPTFFSFPWDLGRSVVTGWVGGRRQGKSGELEPQGLSLIQPQPLAPWTALSSHLTTIPSSSPCPHLTLWPLPAPAPLPG